MTVERDIAGFALPFAAGTAAAVYAGASSCHQAAFVAILLSMTVPLIILMSPQRRRISHVVLWMLICMTAAGTGAFCGLAGNEHAVSDTDGILMRAMLRIGAMLERTADEIPFRDARTASFIKAVLSGERGGMPADVTAAFRESGASHILALSGLHLGIIYMMINRLLSVLGFSTGAVKARSLLTVLFCCIYTLATGAGPSTVRALLFILLNEAAGLSGRYRSTGNTLMAALIIHLCISPSDIRSAGFQLSYAAMAGIAFVYPCLKNMWPEDRSESVLSRIMTTPMRRIWDSAAMSIACQVTTGPIAFICFGTFPKHFLLTNLIALPLTGVIIPTGAALLLLQGAGICPDLLVRFTEWITGLLIRALEIISTM